MPSLPTTQAYVALDNSLHATEHDAVVASIGYAARVYDLSPRRFAKPDFRRAVQFLLDHVAEYEEPSQ